MIILWLAVLGATVVVAVMVGLVYLAAHKVPPTLDRIAPWAARLWAINAILELAILYVFEPALTGPYWGGQWLLWPLVLTGVLALFGGSFGHIRAGLDSLTEEINGDTMSRLILVRGRGSLTGRAVDAEPARMAPATAALAGGLAVALVFVILIAFNGLVTIATTWGDGNVAALAAIPTMVMEPAGTGLPATDVNHIVLVNQGVAAYLGQQVLASNGQNFGSIYHTDYTQYTLQSVRKHLYWIAPLVYNNVWANLGRAQSPGYVVVDAEDPNATPVLKTGYHMRYLPTAIFNQDLIRHVYLSGYTNGNLVDPTFEVNDNWQPYFTIALMQPSRGFTGTVLRDVLLVDPQSGAIAAYAPGAVPAWVDRVMPASTVGDYLNWWGKYHAPPRFNASGANQQVPAGQMELVYNNVDQPVWLQPMTASAGADKSSTGVVLFDTRDGIGHFYPVSGLDVSDNVSMTFASNPLNVRAYAVGTLELYSVYGEPTWVATFVKDNTDGQSFQAVGMVDARQVSAANVIMAPSKSEALAAYAQWLADHNVQGVGATALGHKVTVRGQVARVSAAQQLGSTVYYLYLSGQGRIFQAGVDLSPELPLVQPGDTVQLTYLDTGLNVVTITGFTDLNIPLNGTPAPTSTPSATP